MNFNEINPYIRFAIERDLLEDYTRALAAYDFRLFYGLSGKIWVEVDGARLKFILTLAARNVIKRDRNRPRVVEDVLDFVCANYNRSITNALIAKHFVYHPNYINHLQQP